MLDFYLMMSKFKYVIFLVFFFLDIASNQLLQKLDPSRPNLRIICLQVQCSIFAYNRENEIIILQTYHLLLQHLCSVMAYLNIDNRIYVYPSYSWLDLSVPVLNAPKQFVFAFLNPHKTSMRFSDSSILKEAFTHHKELTSFLNWALGKHNRPRVNLGLVKLDSLIQFLNVLTLCFKLAHRNPLINIFEFVDVSHWSTL